MAQDRNKWISSLYETQYTKMYQVGYRLTGDAELTLDLIQQTFLLALFRSEDLAGHPKQEAWLMKTLTNLIRNEQRRLRSRDIPLDSLGAMAAPAERESWDSHCLDGLSPKDREVLLWRYEQGLDYRDMAGRLGISESGCRDRVARAVKRLKKLLEEE